MTSQKLNFRNYGICQDILKDWRSPLAKNKHFRENFLWDISPVTPWWLPTNPSEFDLESSEHNWSNILRDNLPHNASFRQTGLLDGFLSEYPDKSNNLKFICFYDVTL